MPVEGILQTVQKIATAVHRLDEMAEDVRELRLTVASRLEKLEGEVQSGGRASGTPLVQVAARNRPGQRIASPGIAVATREPGRSWVVRAGKNFRLTPALVAGRLPAMRPDEFEDAQWLWKMFSAGQSFKQAQAAAESVLREELEEDGLCFVRSSRRPASNVGERRALLRPGHSARRTT